MLEAELLTLIFLVILVFCIPNVNKLHRGHDANCSFHLSLLSYLRRNLCDAAASHKVSEIKYKYIYDND